MTTFKGNPNRLTTRKRSYDANRLSRGFASSDGGWTGAHDPSKCLLCMIEHGVLKPGTEKAT